LKQKRHWRIEGFDGTNNFYKKDVPHHLFSDKQIKELLRRLASRHLTETEIIDASGNRAKNRNSLLEIRKNQKIPVVIVCGENPFYSAKIVKE